jgi:GNAT superfamily N-acetyltransferase
MASDVKVTVSTPANFRRALGWVYRGLPAPDQTGQVDEAAQELRPDNVMVATLAGQMVAAMIFRCGAGRVAWVWPPDVQDAGPEINSFAAADVAARLIEGAVERLGQAGCRLVQALVPPGSVQTQPLEVSGFRRITDVICMRRDGAEPIASAVECPTLQFLPCSAAVAEDFPRIVQRSYVGSFDCPELDGLRPIDEVLEGYRDSGVFRPDLWLLARHCGEDIGCVLLCYWPDEQRCELQYMGVVPEARGKRFGLALCVRAIEKAREIAAEELCLAVDERNGHAKSVYKCLGFEATDHRSVFIRAMRAALSRRPV